MPAKKSKKPSKLPKNLLLGIATNVAVGPLGFRAALDTNPKDENNPEPSRIVFCEGESGGREPPVAGTSATVAIHDIEEVDRPEPGNIANSRREVEPAMGRKVPEQDRGNTAFGAPVVHATIKEEAVSGFGPLRSLLGAISAAYANREEAIAVENKVEVLLSCAASLDALFATSPGEAAERRRRDEAKREIKIIEGKLRSLSEGPGPQWLIDHAQHDEGVFSLLEDLRETIFGYQV
ncbi:hypothetical protein BJ322DRAFT_1096259 [Thelephora terrestris]|uniref:Uncharacterized protein n=1 Tax=Thelephora terrestris TaxID=56493 RepID=A0A9P6L0Z4_9AGAM|nr:hypothetical protein BJ322DRAFT_1096259 [Thelephora terrestris]